MSLRRRDRWLRAALTVCGASAGSILLLMIGFLAIESRAAIANIGPKRFFTDDGWHPTGREDQGEFLMTPMIVGSAAATLGATLIAAPLGMGTAIFVHVYAPAWLAGICRRIIELLAGAPSVIVGLWGLTTIAPLVRRLAPPGPSLLAAMIVLSLMILPTIAVLSEASLASVSRELIRGGAALGLSRWAGVRRLLLPAARAGIGASVLLAVGRALGETMAVVMVAGNVVQYPSSLFSPVRTLTANMALEMSYALDVHRSALFVGALALLIVAVVLAIAAEWLGRSQEAPS